VFASPEELEYARTNSTIPQGLDFQGSLILSKCLDWQMSHFQHALMTLFSNCIFFSISSASALALDSGCSSASLTSKPRHQGISTFQLNLCGSLPETP
jgi:hypothetical protein